MLLYLLFVCVCVGGDPVNFQQCGMLYPDPSSLVIGAGGRNAWRGEVPWHAGIYSKSKMPYMQFCGGSLISHDIVLSAAHCFWGDLEKQQPASQFAVAVGKLYRPWNDPNDEAQKSDVKVIHFPPRYQGALADFQDDIAVVVVAEAFQFTKYIRPICLSFDHRFEKKQLYPGNNGKVAGWGLTEADGKASPTLQLLDLPYVEVSTCIQNLSPDFREYITSDKICAGKLDSKLALCKGDSGGGLAFPESVRGIERYFLRGVVSTAANSEHACNVDTYTSFTSITKHEQFIKEFWSEHGADEIPVNYKGFIASNRESNQTEVSSQNKTLIALNLTPIKEITSQETSQQRRPVSLVASLTPSVQTLERAMNELNDSSEIEDREIYHQREMEKFRLLSRKIEYEENRNRVLYRLANNIDNLTKVLTLLPVYLQQTYEDVYNEDNATHPVL